LLPHTNYIQSVASAQADVDSGRYDMVCWSGSLNEVDVDGARYDIAARLGAGDTPQLAMAYKEKSSATGP
jgi:hypothetical protein